MATQIATFAYFYVVLQKYRYDYRQTMERLWHKQLVSARHGILFAVNPICTFFSNFFSTLIERILAYNAFSAVCSLCFFHLFALYFQLHRWEIIFTHCSISSSFGCSVLWKCLLNRGKGWLGLRLFLVTTECLLSRDYF